MENVIKLLIGLLALTASVFAANDQFLPFEFFKGSLHRQAQKGKLITPEELTAENIRALAPTRRDIAFKIMHRSRSIELIETGEAVTLLEVTRNTFLNSCKRETY